MSQWVLVTMCMHASKQAVALEEVWCTEYGTPQQHREHQAGGGQGCLSRPPFPKLEIKHAAGRSVRAREMLDVKKIRCHIFLSEVSHLYVRQQFSGLAVFRYHQSKEPWASVVQGCLSWAAAEPSSWSYLCPAAWYLKLNHTLSWELTFLALTPALQQIFKVNCFNIARIW